jgi:hypothetical protein
MCTFEQKTHIDQIHKKLSCDSLCFDKRLVGICILFMCVLLATAIFDRFSPNLYKVFVSRIPQSSSKMSDIGILLCGKILNNCEC